MVSDLDPGEAVTIRSRLGDALPEPAVDALVPAPPDERPGVLLPGVVGLGAASVAAAAASRRARRAGREMVWEGGPADVAFGGGAGDARRVRLVDHDELARMTTIEFEPPRGVSAVAGGIVREERVRSDHLVAWLLEAAIRDEVSLEGSSKKDFVLRRGAAEAHPSVAKILDVMFDGRASIALGEYDEDFGKGWTQLRHDLDEWATSSGMWTDDGRRRRTRAAVVGVLAGLVGLAITALSGGLTLRVGPPWLVGVGVGGVAAGAGLAMAIRSWELAVRTPEGSAMWLRVESFRRFIADSEARHVADAARMGLLRHYTAWAVALGEADHWSKVVDAAAATDPTVASMPASHLAFASMAPTISSAAQTASTAPSSDGGGGGGAGGGGGGGGGGSW